MGQSEIRGNLSLYDKQLYYFFVADSPGAFRRDILMYTRKVKTKKTPRCMIVNLRKR